VTTAFLAPVLQNTFFIPGSNTPGNGVQLFLYASGSSTKQTAYQESTASTAWSNPIVLDSGGNLPSGTKEVWFVSGQTYKAVYAPSNDTDPPVSPYLTLDNLSGINDSNASVSEWVAGATPTFISASSFSVSGDQTLLYTVGRRLKATVTAGTVYGSIISSLFGGGLTTVGVRLDSGALDSGLSAASYGLLQAVNPSIPTAAMDQPTQTVASSSTTLNLASTAARSLIISSTNPVSTMPIADGQVKFLEFSGALTLFHNATTFPLPGAANISTAAGDTAIARGESGLTRVLMYQKSATGGTPTKKPTVTTFTASSGTYTTPTAATWLRVRLVGGGGGGGAATTNGGTSGNNTTFSTLTGGGGGSGAASAAGGTGGTAAGGDINIPGGTGGPGATALGTTQPGGGPGGNTALGGGGRGGVTGADGGAGGTNSGGGGGGGGQSASACGGGGGGGGYVEKVFTTVATSYAFSVGAAANGGAAGGQAGGAGAAGIIIVDEHYT
jgi:hypothetical protein